MAMPPSFRRDRSASWFPTQWEVRPTFWGDWWQIFWPRTSSKRPLSRTNPAPKGGIGAEAVARGDAEGYSLLVVSGSMLVLNPMLYKKLSYEPVRDFRVLALITEVPV